MCRGSQRSRATSYSAGSGACRGELAPRAGGPQPRANAPRRLIRKCANLLVDGVSWGELTLWVRPGPSAPAIRDRRRAEDVRAFKVGRACGLRLRDALKRSPGHAGRGRAGRPAQPPNRDGHARRPGAELALAGGGEAGNPLINTAFVNSSRPSSSCRRQCPPSPCPPRTEWSAASSQLRALVIARGPMHTRGPHTQQPEEVVDVLARLC